MGEGILLSPPNPAGAQGSSRGAGMPLLSPSGSGCLLQRSGAKLPVPLLGQGACRASVSNSCSGSWAELAASEQEEGESLENSPVVA